MRTILILFIFTSLSACTSQFAYRHLDWIIVWYSADFLDLTYEQEDAFTKQLDLVLHWHRYEELPKYKKVLINLTNDINQLPLSPQKVETYSNSIFYFWRSIRSKSSSLFTPSLMSLGDDQVEDLFSKLEQKNIKRLDSVNRDTAAKRINDLEKWEDLLVEFLGGINSVQYALIEEYLDKRSNTTELRVQYLRSYQSHIKQAMLTPNNSETLEALLKDSDPFKPEIYRIKQHDNRLATYQLISDLSLHMTPNQVQHLTNKINDYIQFIDEMTSSR